MFCLIVILTCEAYSNNLLLAGERTDELGAAVTVELKRQAVSRRDRENAATKIITATTASPPTVAELTRCFIYIASGVQMPSEWLATLSKVRGTITREAHKATVFIAVDPWQPSEPIVTWAACLSGAWVISPECFVGRKGASRKFKAAICTKRTVWVSANFQSSFSLEWLVLLEILSPTSSAPKHQWKLISTAAEWVAARVTAERQKKPTEVIALVGSDEALQLNNSQPKSCHAFNLAGACTFLANIDQSRGSVGLLEM